MASKQNQKISEKIKLGQFFTTKELWLKPQIIDFIRNSKCNIAYDPFAGSGSLLNAVKFLKFKKYIGLDISSDFSWKINDSLLNIPHINNSIIITNPPYLAKQSATRKNIDYSKYFIGSKYNDIYLIALQKMIESQQYVVAIIPESFINSNFYKKNLLHSITILEENPFVDTENPVCVVCFDGIAKEPNKIKIYKNSEYINNLKKIFDIRLKPNNSVKMNFNDLSGWLAFRAIDSTDDKKRIAFDFKKNIKYDWINNIKISSRHMSLINVNIPVEKRHDFINLSNQIIENIRKKSADVILTPFKGNTKNGIRRRRMDFKLARAILELVYQKLIFGEKYERQLVLF